jgi:hypothetical protein
MVATDSPSKKTRKSNSPKQMLYYPARLDGTHPSALIALQSVGINHVDAVLLIENAKINQSPLIFADIGGGKGVLVAPTESGEFQLWQAIIGEASPDSGYAEAFTRALAQTLGDGSTFAIFRWSPPMSTTNH